MGAALKADQPLANFPSRLAYPALRCHTELSGFSGARQGWLGAPGQPVGRAGWLQLGKLEDWGPPLCPAPPNAAGTKQPASPQPGTRPRLTPASLVSSSAPESKGRDAISACPCLQPPPAPRRSQQHECRQRAG